jgi:hypothetical protein
VNKTSKEATPSQPTKSHAVTIAVKEGEDEALVTAKVMAGPLVGNAFAMSIFTEGTLGELPLDSLSRAMTANADRVKLGDMTDIEATLVSQATVLNALFADLVRRSAININACHLEAGERFLKLGFKAQNQCRMTIETLALLKNPPVFVRQANVAHGRQVVNNGIISPSRAGEKQNAPNELLESDIEQPLDTGTPGSAGGGNSALAAVGTLDRAAKPTG